MPELTTFQIVIASLIAGAGVIIAVLCLCALAAEPVEQDSEYL